MFLEKCTKDNINNSVILRLVLNINIIIDNNI
jgi:hypothetical protein